MTRLAISVQNLSKQYQVGVKPPGSSTFGEAVSAALKSPWRRFRRLASRASEAERFWALRDVSFDIAGGSCVGIIGQNGAGKSTLLKILSRIAEPTSGRAILDGRVGSLLEVGTGFHEELTGRENVYLNGSILGMSRREISKKFDAIVDFSGVEAFLDTPMKRYSSGMAVRLAFAVAAHVEPEILIVDEILAVGDADFQKKCLGKMRDVASGGRTVLFVSHNMATIRGLCETVYWMKSGRVERSGPAEDIVPAYLGSQEDEQSQEIDLASRPRAGSAGEVARLTRFEWLSPIPAEFDAPVACRVTFEVLRPASELAVGLGICSLDGQRFITFDSDQNGPRLTASPGETVTLDLAIDSCMLSPGRYPIDLGIRSGPLHSLDYLPAAMQLEVVVGPQTPPNVLQFRGVGLRLPGRWDRTVAA